MRKPSMDAVSLRFFFPDLAHMTICWQGRIIRKYTEDSRSLTLSCAGIVRRYMKQMLSQVAPSGCGKTYLHPVRRM